MKAKLFFDLALKLFGIYYFVNAFTSIPQLIAYFGMAAFAPNWFQFQGSGVLSVVITILFYMLVGYVFVFKSEKITRLVIKDDSETVDVQFNLILSVALIVTGCLMVINNAPLFLMKMFNQVQNSETSPLLLSVIKIAIGCLLVYYNNDIVRWLEKRSKI